METVTLVLTREQCEAMKLAVLAAIDEWRKRASILGTSGLASLEEMATEIRERIRVLRTCEPLLYRYELPEPAPGRCADSATVTRPLSAHGSAEAPINSVGASGPASHIPYADPDDYRERRYESPESAHGVGRAFL